MPSLMQSVTKSKPLTGRGDLLEKRRQLMEAWAAHGDSSGLRRAQANAAMLAGLAHAIRGEGSHAVELCERALEISPDDFETAFILACLGKACEQTGDLARALGARLD